MKPINRILNSDLPVSIHRQFLQLPFKEYLLPAFVSFLLGLLFDPENESDILLPKRRNLSELHSITRHKTVLLTRKRVLTTLTTGVRIMKKNGKQDYDDHNYASNTEKVFF
jgi:hypothetical protein